MSASAPAALDDTRVWLEKAVIGLNLCPFAKAVHAKGQVRWVLSEATQPLELLEELVRELRHLEATPAEKTDTTLIVHPGVLQAFDDFNDFLGVAEDALDELGLAGTLQIASFHPQFQFEGTEPDDITNHTNRAPHPTLHLLREDSIDRAVASVPDAAEIYERNMQTLQRLGLQGWQRLFSEEEGSA